VYHILSENARKAEDWIKKKKGKQVRMMTGPGGLCQMEGVPDDDCIEILREGLNLDHLLVH